MRQDVNTRPGRGLPEDAVRRIARQIVGARLRTGEGRGPRGQTVDRRTDISAFGCVLYEMVTGRRAFARATWSDTLAAVLASDLDWSAWPSDVSPGLRALAARCVEPNPKTRLRDIADARHDLAVDDSTAARAAAGTRYRCRRISA